MKKINEQEAIKIANAYANFEGYKKTENLCPNVISNSDNIQVELINERKGNGVDYYFITIMDGSITTCLDTILVMEPAKNGCGLIECVRETFTYTVQGDHLNIKTEQRMKYGFTNKAKPLYIENKSDSALEVSGDFNLLSQDILNLNEPRLCKRYTLSFKSKWSGKN